MTLMHININGLLHKFQQLKYVIDNENFDVIIMTKSHLTDQIDDNAVHIQGYNIYRSNTNNNKTTGIMIYAKEQLKVEKIIDGRLNSINSNLLIIEMS